MLSSVLSPSSRRSIAADALSRAKSRFEDCTNGNYASLVFDEACFTAGERMREEVERTLGVAGTRVPFGFWERAAVPDVEAAFGFTRDVLRVVGQYLTPGEIELEG